jgi:23S rRNA (adenine2503-C2)-methyltransferase
MEAMVWVTSETGMGWSNQRITLSTSGIPDKIRQMADDNIKINLAISLHSANPQKRINLLPVSKKYSLEMLADSLMYYTQKTKQKITIEYLLLKGVNDSVTDAEELVKFCSRFASKINLIEYNPVVELPFERSTSENTALFLKTLESKNILAKIRRSRGKDIDAACGQLANKGKINGKKSK